MEVSFHLALISGLGMAENRRKGLLTDTGPSWLVQLVSASTLLFLLDLGALWFFLFQKQSKGVHAISLRE